MEWMGLRKHFEKCYRKLGNAYSHDFSTLATFRSERVTNLTFLVFRSK